MHAVDLTHVIEEQMPVYPGTEGPKLVPANSYAESGFRETCLTMYSHTGTHMDAPAHLYPTGKTLDVLPITQFSGTAVVIHCSELQAGERIAMHKRLHGPKGSYSTNPDHMPDAHRDFTGWSRYWGQAAYYGDYPYITHQVADWLLKTGKKGIGLDTIGLDPIADETLTLHRKLLADDRMVIIENLTNLEQVGDGVVFFCALPLKQADADGAPIRAAVFWAD